MKNNDKDDKKDDLKAEPDPVYQQKKLDKGGGKRGWPKGKPRPPRVSKSA